MSKYEGVNPSPVEDGRTSSRRPVMLVLLLAVAVVGGGYAWEPVSRFIAGFQTTFEKTATKPAPAPKNTDRPAPAPPATQTPPASRPPATTAPPSGTSSSSSGSASTIGRGTDRDLPEATPSPTGKPEPGTSPAGKPAAAPRKPSATPAATGKLPDWMPALTVAIPIGMLAIFGAIVFFVIAKVRRGVASTAAAGPGRGAAWGKQAATPAAPAKRGFRMPPVFSLIFGAIVLDQIFTGGRYARMAIAFAEKWIATNMP